MNEKVYTPEVIQDTPFPGEPLIGSTQSPTSSSNVLTPTTTKDNQFKRKKIAIELLSTALNTRSKKILQEFELQQSGGLQIGNFQEGLSGDIRLTPNGITGRNIAGITTFAVDGDTGDAVFLGNLIAGTVMAGDSNVIIENGSSGGRIVLYNDGIPSILIGDST